MSQVEHALWVHEVLLDCGVEGRGGPATVSDSPALLPGKDVGASSSLQAPQLCQHWCEGGSNEGASGTFTL